MGARDPRDPRGPREPRDLGVQNSDEVRDPKKTLSPSGHLKEACTGRRLLEPKRMLRISRTPEEKKKAHTSVSIFFAPCLFFFDLFAEEKSSCLSVSNFDFRVYSCLISIFVSKFLFSCLKIDEFVSIRV